MAKKPTRKTLPKNLDELLEAAAASSDYAEVQRALEQCLPDARGGYGKGTLLMHPGCTREPARWAIERAAETFEWARGTLSCGTCSFRRREPARRFRVK